jgi:hypothetical protein
MSETAVISPPSAGTRFVAALAAKDAPALRSALADTVDFQALTPGRHWLATTPAEAVDDIVLGRWFGPDDDIREVRVLTDEAQPERRHLAYRLHVHRADGEDYVVEQQAYYLAEDQRITWMRVLCSGYQRADA